MLLTATLFSYCFYYCSFALWFNLPDVSQIAFSLFALGTKTVNKRYFQYKHTQWNERMDGKNTKETDRQKKTTQTQILNECERFIVDDTRNTSLKHFPMSFLAWDKIIRKNISIKFENWNSISSNEYLASRQKNFVFKTLEFSLLHQKWVRLMQCVARVWPTVIVSFILCVCHIRFHAARKRIYFVDLSL